jgi:hypothetical protein
MLGMSSLMFCKRLCEEVASTAQMSGIYSSGLYPDRNTQIFLVLTVLRSYKDEPVSEMQKPYVRFVHNFNVLSNFFLPIQVLD